MFKYILSINLRTVLFYTPVTLAWDCSNYTEQKTHTWCEHGCCFDKDPVRCCTWAEYVIPVFAIIKNTFFPFSKAYKYKEKCQCKH